MPTSYVPRVFVKNNQQQLLNTELPEAMTPVGENRNWLKILKGKVGGVRCPESWFGKLQNIPGDPEDQSHRQGWANAQKRPKEGPSLTLTDLEALSKQEAKAEAGLSAACGGQVTAGLVSDPTQQGTQGYRESTGKILNKQQNEDKHGE